jgi:hypothetical protein
MCQFELATETVTLLTGFPQKKKNVTLDCKRKLNLTQRQWRDLFSILNYVHALGVSFRLAVYWSSYGLNMYFGAGIAEALLYDGRPRSPAIYIDHTFLIWTVESR